MSKEKTQEKQKQSNTLSSGKPKKASNTQQKSKSEKQKQTVKASDQDFDWNAKEEAVYIDYSDKERKELEKQYEATITPIEENDIVQAKVVGVTDNDVILSINSKADGLVSVNEFRDIDELKEGQAVEVFVEKREDEKGQIVLSRKKAKLLRGWEKIRNAHDNNEVIEGRVIAKTKGGLIAEVEGYETFLPGSQIDVKPIVDYDYYVGKTMEFKVVKINESIMNAVVSHKALIESELESQRKEIIAKLEKGQVLEGTVKNLTDFGAFIDLGGVDGLLYLSDISWGRINHPSEVLELNQRLNVVVLDFDDDKKRISLGLKQLQKHPWDELGEALQEGKKVEGKVVNIEDYGAFLELKPGVEGLIHVSEISWSLKPMNPKEYFNLGEKYDAVIVNLNREDRKMSLSIKRLEQDPWEKVSKNYEAGSKHTGTVISLTPYGAFVELEEGIGGLVHISDFSWTKRIGHPSEFTKTGEKMEVVVLDVDEENRRLSLGHKQLEEDPWESFETVFPVDSVHEGTIERISGKDAVVRLPYGVETTVHMNDLIKEDGARAKEEETLPFKVVKFDQAKKSIVVSHKKVYEDAKKDKGRADGPKQKQSSSKKRKKPPVEKSKLGDLEVLSDLKEKMSQDDKGKEMKAKGKTKTQETKETADSDKKEKAKKKSDKASKDGSKDKKKANTSEKADSGAKSKDKKDTSSSSKAKKKKKG